MEEGSSEKSSLLLKIERKIFTHQDEFNEAFHKDEPPVKQEGIVSILFNECISSFPRHILCYLL